MSSARRGVAALIFSCRGIRAALLIFAACTGASARDRQARAVANSGVPGSAHVLVVDDLGRWRPARNSPLQVSLAVRDERAGKAYLAAGARARLDLFAAPRPFPRLRWDAGSVRVTETFFCAAARHVGMDAVDFGDMPWVAFWTVHLVNNGDTPAALSLYVLAEMRPRTDQRKTTPILSAERLPTYARGALLVFDPGERRSPPRSERGERVALATSEEAAERAVFKIGADGVADPARSGNALPKGKERIAGRGPLGAALRFRVQLQPGEARVFSFHVPAMLVVDRRSAARRLMLFNRLDPRRVYSRVRAGFDALLRITRFEVPDKDYQQAVEQALCWLHLSRDDEATLEALRIQQRQHGLPGADALRAMAFSAMGQRRVADAILRELAGTTTTDGLPSDGRISGTPHRLENQPGYFRGLLMHALVRHARLYADTRFLRDVFPAVSRLARSVHGLRRGEAVVPGVALGLVGNRGRDHHTFLSQNIAALGGLRDAAYAARVVGNLDTARWCDREARSLERAIRGRMRAVQRLEDGPGYASGQRLGTPMMVDRLWMFDDLLLPSDLAEPTATARAQRLGSRISQPRNMRVVEDMSGMAHALRMAGRDADALVYWRRARDYVAPSRTHPDQWMAPPDGPAVSQFLLLARDMLVDDRSDALGVTPCVPPSWYDEGQRIRVTRAPTNHGLVTYEVRVARGAPMASLSIRTGRVPPGGLRWELPVGYAWKKARTDSGPVRVGAGSRVLALPAGAHAAVGSFTRPE